MGNAGLTPEAKDRIASAKRNNSDTLNLKDCNLKRVRNVFHLKNEGCCSKDSCISKFAKVKPE